MDFWNTQLGRLDGLPINHPSADTPRNSVLGSGTGISVMLSTSPSDAAGSGTPPSQDGQIQTSMSRFTPTTVLKSATTTPGFENGETNGTPRKENVCGPEGS